MNWRFWQFLSFNRTGLTYKSLLVENTLFKRAWLTSIISTEYSSSAQRIKISSNEGCRNVVALWHDLYFRLCFHPTRTKRALWNSFQSSMWLLAMETFQRSVLAFGKRSLRYTVINVRRENSTSSSFVWSYRTVYICFMTDIEFLWSMLPIFWWLKSRMKIAEDMGEI